MGELSNTTINGVSYDFKDAGAARQSHSHTKSQITDFPTSMPASDVSAWAKASTKPTYTASEVGAVPTTRMVNLKALSGDIELTGADLFVDATSEYTVADLLTIHTKLGFTSSDTTKYELSKDQSYGCVINQLASIHLCIHIKTEIAAGAGAYLGRIIGCGPRGYYNFYPFAVCFVRTPIAGVYCYTRGNSDPQSSFGYVYLENQNTIPSDKYLYINGTFLTETGLPDLPT